MQKQCAIHIKPLDIEALGLTVEALNWFKSYLTGRKQCIDIDGTQSGWLDVELGVPQVQY